MNKAKALKMMDEVIRYIPDVFENQQKLKKHLSCMRYWADIEWFNLLSILYQYPNATSVRTTKAWNKTFNKELFPKRSERGIQIFLPIYIGDLIEWKIVKVFDISQMQTFLKPQYTSYLQNTINTINNKYLETGEEGWQKQVILNTMMSLSSFKRLTKEEIKFSLNCVLVSCGDLLGVSIDVINEIDLSHSHINDCTILYKFIKDTIAGLHEEVIKYVEVIEHREKTKKEIAEALMYSKMTIKQKIVKAKSIANNRLQIITDSESQMTIEDENFTGLPAGEIVYDEDIYKGEI